jgi:hypothetical protein
MYSVPVPTFANHFRSSSTTNSGPLSERMFSGIPRYSVTSASASITSYLSSFLILGPALTVYALVRTLAGPLAKSSEVFPITRRRDLRHSYLRRAGVVFSRTGSFKSKEAASPVYKAFKQLENGEFVQVASCDLLEEAVQLVDSLNAVWPGGYEVRESQSQIVRHATNFRSVVN